MSCSSLGTLDGISNLKGTAGPQTNRTLGKQSFEVPSGIKDCVHVSLLRKLGLKYELGVRSYESCYFFKKETVKHRKKFNNNCHSVTKF